MSVLAGSILEGGEGAAVPGQDGTAEGVPPAAGAPTGAAGPGEAILPKLQTLAACAGS